VQAGDWSNLSPDDIKANCDAVAGGARIFSSYTSRQKSESGSSQKLRVHQVRSFCRKNTDPVSSRHAIGPTIRHPDRKWTGRGHASAADKASLAMCHAQPHTSDLVRVSDAPIHGFELRGSALASDPVAR